MPEISLAEVSELQGKGVDVLTSHVVNDLKAKSASNDPADAEAKVKVETEAKAAEEAKKPQKVDDGMQKRMDELTRARHKAERETAAERTARLNAEEELKALREQVAKDAPKPVRPKREDFEDNEAFTDALVDFKLAEKSAKEAEEQRGKDAKESESRTKREGETAAREREEEDRKQAEAIIARFGESLEKAKKAHPDWDEVVTNQSAQVKPGLHAALLHSKVGGELVYHLGKNPEEVSRLNGLDQASMLKELGKIELSLTPKGSDGAVDQPRGDDGKFVPKDAKEISSAAKPIEPVTGHDAGAGAKDPERMSVAEHREAAYRAGRTR